MITNYEKILSEISLKKTNYKKVNIMFLSNYNNFILKDYLKFFLQKKKIDPHFFKNNYDQIEEILFKKEIFENYDFCILAYDVNSRFYLDEQRALKYLNIIKANFIKILSNKYLKNKNIIFFNLNKIINYDLNIKSSIINQHIDKFNKWLKKISLTYKNISFLDIDKISLQCGLKNIYDMKNNYLFKSPYSELANNLIASDITKIIYSKYFINKKCLILDLDNTLWGGVLGELGPHNIDLGKTFNGYNFLKFQKYIKSLKERGVLLAIISKNNYRDVIECFRINKNMILKINDFSAIKVNWEHKYKNLKKILNELNIGSDSAVFFDDSKFEREEMRSYFKDVEIIDVPKNNENFIQSIEDSYFFLNNSITKEDNKKNFYYKILKKAQNFSKKFKTHNDFLKSLNMQIEISNINKTNFERCLQLINKTNQFNLTLKRYNEIELDNFIKKKNQYTFNFRLKDRFGDHGITGLCMINYQNSIWTVDNYLLSCRVLGRKIEFIFLNEILKILKKKKIKRLYGFFKNTKKNESVSNFYVLNGFKREKKKNVYFIDLNKLNKVKNNIIQIKNKI